METYSPAKHQEKKIDKIPTTSTTKHHAQRISDMSVRSFNLKKTAKLPPVG